MGLTWNRFFHSWSAACITYSNIRWEVMAQSIMYCFTISMQLFIKVVDAIYIISVWADDNHANSPCSPGLLQLLWDSCIRELWNRMQLHPSKMHPFLYVMIHILLDYLFAIPYQNSVTVYIYIYCLWIFL